MGASILNAVFEEENDRKINETIIKYLSDNILEPLVATVKEFTTRCQRAKKFSEETRDLAPVVQTMDSAIHRINHYSLGNSIDFASVYPLASDLSGG